jgi:hypothetical protein
VRNSRTKKVVEEVVALPPAEEVEEEVQIACNAPAPLVVNGAAYVGCMLAQGHEEQHEIRVTWVS